MQNRKNSPASLSDKQKLRERVWREMARLQVARFPGAKGRIPNFKGAERCVDQLVKIDAWRRARVLKCNPDSPQAALRRRALEEGKLIYMAVPRLREKKCFLELDPKRIKNPKQAASIKGAARHGKGVGLDAMRKIDLVVCGSVVVNRRGERLGKGGGYSDLEFALAKEAGWLGDRTPILTTVHPAQIVEQELPWRPHDIPVDFIVTPEEVIRTRPRRPRPEGILWDFLEEEKISEIPVLQALG